jgi:hypothetical protein
LRRNPWTVVIDADRGVAGSLPERNDDSAAGEAAGVVDEVSDGLHDADAIAGNGGLPIDYDVDGGLRQ